MPLAAALDRDGQRSWRYVASRPDRRDHRRLYARSSPCRITDARAGTGQGSNRKHHAGVREWIEALQPVTGLPVVTIDTSTKTRFTPGTAQDGIQLLKARPSARRVRVGRRRNLDRYSTKNCSAPINGDKASLTPF